MRGRTGTPWWTLVLVVLVVASLAVFAAPGDARKKGKRPKPTPAASIVPVPSVAPPASVPPSPSGPPAADPSPRPTPVDISSRLTSTLSAINLGGATVTITLYLWDPQTDERQPLDFTLDLAPADSISQMVFPGFYSVTFTGVADAALECTFMTGFTKEILMNPTQEALDSIAPAELDFAILSSDVLVVDPTVDVQSADDLRIATAPLCLGPDARAELGRILGGE